MSDFLLGQHSSYPIENKAKNSFTSFAELYTHHDKVMSVSLSRNECDSIWAPIADPKTQTHMFILGRPSLENSQILNHVAQEKKQACLTKYLLDNWLSNQTDFHTYLNGYFAIIIVTQQQIHVFTDKLGVYPVFKSRHSPTLKLASHPDNLTAWLHDEEMTVTLNMQALAETLATGSSFSQASFYNEIDALKPATHYVFHLEQETYTESSQPYWSIEQQKLQQPQKKWSQDIAQAITNAMAKRTHQFSKKNALLLSGGADSRAILFAHPHPNQLCTITFCDAYNAEANTAKKLANIAQSSHQIWFRDYDHYGHAFTESIKTTGGLWSIKDAHYLSFKEKLVNNHWDTIFTGCYADYLLKGLGINKKHTQFLGKPIPLYVRAPMTSHFYQPHFTLNDNWQPQLNASLNQYYEFEQTTVDKLENKRISPLYKEADAMGRLYLMRCTAWESIFCDNEIIDLYCKMPADIKLNYRTFAEAVQSIVPEKAKKVINNNHGGRLDASEFGIKCRYLLRRFKSKVLRKLRPKTTSIATQASWPNFVSYIQHSAEFKHHWQSVSPQAQTLIKSMLAHDPWLKPLHEWNDDNNDLILRALTIGLWLDLTANTHQYLQN
ncbi:hypothetical protein PULV_a0213 [Pseudoalteromonas ulvae UL12]|uniref:asparagine synthase-related protein n=1 Tax=Pseudoalteromonas ulvae TaxID=107327 RepID=UPI00186B6C44|nr:asparagine synthase-related protein [Pseudoalteromonas ulvae]MBE0362674.1 hypothetical protein [Pseudoalteromonas ulvae UL12]